MGNSYKTTCPSCGRDNYYVTPRNGMAYCFSPDCGYMEREGNAPKKTRIRSDHIAEIRTLYAQMAHYYHSALTPQAVSFLHKRGFTDQTIQDQMIGYCPPGTLPMYKTPIAKEAGLATQKDEAFLADRITFPYFRDNGVVTDIRARSLDPLAELRYKSPFGDIYFRGAIYPYNYHLRHNKRILFTEGEIKADIAVQIGYPTLAIPGIGAWRSGFVQDDGQEVIIVFDNESNPNTQRAIIAAVRKVAGELVRPKIAVLPIFGSEKKAEIDTFVQLHGIDLFARVIDNAISYSQWEALQNYF